MNASTPYPKPAVHGKVRHELNDLVITEDVRLVVEDGRLSILQKPVERDTATQELEGGTLDLARGGA